MAVAAHAARRLVRTLRRPDSDLKYYWTKHDLVLSPWDETLRWQKERICD